MEFAKLKIWPVSVMHFTNDYLSLILLVTFFQLTWSFMLCISRTRQRWSKKDSQSTRLDKFESDNLSKESDEHNCSLIYSISFIINSDKRKLLNILKENNLIDLLMNSYNFLRTLNIFSAVTFEVLPPNRYKLAKNYRKLLEKYGKDPEEPRFKKELEQAKVCESYPKRDFVI